MNAGRDVERLLSDWLVEEAPSGAPDRIVLTASDRIDHTKQRRFRVAWRSSSMNAPMRLAAAAVIGVLLLGGAYYLFDGGGPNVGVPAAPSPSPTASPLPFAHGPIEPGTYRVDRGRPGAAVAFSLTIPEGWTSDNYGRIIMKESDLPGEIGLTFSTVGDIFADACGGDDLMGVGPTADDLANALAAQIGPEASGPTDVTLGGYPAKRVDLTVPADLDTETCDPPIGLQIWFAPALEGDHGVEGDYFVVLPDGRATVYVADVGAGRIVFTTQARDASSPEDIAELEAIVASIQIESE